MGDLKVEVYCETTPRTAFNFLALCASGAYDGTQFHRNIKGTKEREYSSAFASPRRRELASCRRSNELLTEVLGAFPLSSPLSFFFFVVKAS